MQSYDAFPGVPVLADVSPIRMRGRCSALVTTPSQIGLPLLGPPGIPPERLEILRASYMRLMEDKDYRAEADKRGLPVGRALGGAELHKLIVQSLSAVPDVSSRNTWRSPGSRPSSAVARVEHCDIIVIGGGSAAFEAAVAAREAGAERVVMLEKAPEAEYGGNARYSGTGFRFVHGGADEIRQFVPDVDDALFATMEIAPYSADDFMADLDRMTQGRMNRALAQTLVEESNAAVHWMRDVGITWEPLKEHAKVDGKRYFERGIAIHVAGGGIGQLDAVAADRRRTRHRDPLRVRRSAPCTATCAASRASASAARTDATTSRPRR